MHKLCSPAKVNLTFRVLRRLECGYHDIETLMQAVSLVDWVSIAIAPKDQIISTLSIAHNLAWQAVELYRQAFGDTDPISIHIEKNIPIQAGLGGGSSNAATVLFALNQIYQRASIDQLRALGRRLGNDVPFFFSCGTALFGNGVILQEKKLPSLLPKWLAVPTEIAMSTKQVYAHCRVGEDLEPAAMRVQPRLAAVKKALLSHFSKVFMTGSGSGFVCYGKSPPELEKIDFYPLMPLRKKDGAWYALG